MHTLLGKLVRSVMTPSSVNEVSYSLNGREKLRKNQTDVAISLSHVSYQNRQTNATATTEDDDKVPVHLFKLSVFI